MANVPAERRCRCRETPRKKEAAAAPAPVTNVGAVDRVLRVALGLIAIMLVFFGPQTPWGWLGLVPLFTGTVGFCPLYRLAGLSTVPRRA